jgi:hypothetical protein
MKRIALFLFVALIYVRADETVKVQKVGEYQDVEFTEIVGDDVKFTHKDGAGRMPLEKLPKDIQTKCVSNLKRSGLTAKQREGLQKMKEEAALAEAKEKERQQKFHDLRIGAIKGALPMLSWKWLFDEEGSYSYWQEFLLKPHEFTEFKGAKLPTYWSRVENGTRLSDTLILVLSEEGIIVAIVAKAKDKRTLITTKWYSKLDHQKLLPEAEIVAGAASNEEIKQRLKELDEEQKKLEASLAPQLRLLRQKVSQGELSLENWRLLFNQLPKADYSDWKKLLLGNPDESLKLNDLEFPIYLLKIAGKTNASDNLVLVTSKAGKIIAVGSQNPKTHSLDIMTTNGYVEKEHKSLLPKADYIDRVKTK